MIENRSPAKIPASSRLMWFTALAGPVAWSLYFMAGYFLAEVACRLEIWRSNFLGLNLLVAILVGLTLAALAVTGYSGFSAYRAWQAAREKRPARGEQARAEYPGQFMFFSGMILSGFFALLILFTGLVTFFLQPCLYY